MTGCGPDAHRAIRVDLHPDLAEGRSRGTTVDETDEIDGELGRHLAERGDERRRESRDATPGGWESGDDADSGTLRIPDRAMNCVEHDLEMRFR